MKITENVPLAQYTTFKIGGPARFFCRVSNEAELVEAVKYAKKRKLPIFVLGGGSNILISDEGYSGLVIKNELKGIGGGLNDEYIAAASGEVWDDLVKYAVGHNLSGIENLSGIPGSVGAAPVQNIGAYGSDVAHSVSRVRIYDTEKMDFIEFDNKECEFGYRESIFKKNKGRYIITAVSFRLTRNGKVNISYNDLQEYFGIKKPKQSIPKTEKLSIFNPKNWFASVNIQDENVKEAKLPSILDVRDAVIEIRANKLPDWQSWGTAGSFFKNPVVSQERYQELVRKIPDLKGHNENGQIKISLGWVIDKVCRLKGAIEGNVSVYDKQALVLVARPGASASDVIRLSKKISECVHKQTGIVVEAEVEWVI